MNKWWKSATSTRSISMHLLLPCFILGKQARPTMGPHPHPFCLNISRQTVLGSCGCLSYMVGSCSCSKHYIPDYHQHPAVNSHNLWTTWNVGIRQWITSAEFHEFLYCNGIRDVTAAPYHLLSNGLAEWAVFKHSKLCLRRLQEGDLLTHLARFLFQYHYHFSSGASNVTSTMLPLGSNTSPDGAMSDG